MKELIRLYWTYRTGGVPKDTAIAWALERAGISAENRDWAYEMVSRELNRRRETNSEVPHAA